MNTVIKKRIPTVETAGKLVKALIYRKNIYSSYILLDH